MGETRITSARALVADTDEVIALWLSFDDYRRQPGFKLLASSLGKIIENET